MRLEFPTPLPGNAPTAFPSGCSGLHAAYQFPVDALAQLPRLRWLHLTGSGADHLAAAALADGVLVTNSARVPVEPVAEYAVSALLILLKGSPH